VGKCNREQGERGERGYKQRGEALHGCTVYRRSA
jgi:hypothetical protein